MGDRIASAERLERSSACGRLREVVNPSVSASSLASPLLLLVPVGSRFTSIWIFSMSLADSLLTFSGEGRDICDEDRMDDS